MRFNSVRYLCTFLQGPRFRCIEIQIVLMNWTFSFVLRIVQVTQKRTLFSFVDEGMLPKFGKIGKISKHFGHPPLGRFYV